MPLPSLLVPLLLAAGVGQSQTVEIPASADTTLIEDPAGALANGSGTILHAGHTSQPANGVRRGLVRFDVAAHVPADAIVENVALSLHCSQTNGGPANVSLHRVLAAWGEGASSTNGGNGAPAAPGDATWLHVFFDDAHWTTPGGDFVPRPSSVALVGDPATYEWSATRRLLEDVRLWQRAPHRNHGWLLRGDEQALTTAKRFDSREHPTAALRPVLRVTWRRP